MKNKNKMSSPRLASKRQSGKLLLRVQDFNTHPISIRRWYRRQRYRQQEALHTDDSSDRMNPEISLGLGPLPKRTRRCYLSLSLSLSFSLLFSSVLPFPNPPSRLCHPTAASY